MVNGTAFSECQILKHIETLGLQRRDFGPVPASRGSEGTKMIGEECPQTQSATLGTLSAGPSAYRREGAGQGLERPLPHPFP